MGASAKRGVSRYYFEVDTKAYEHYAMVVEIIYDGYTSRVLQVLLVL